MLCYCLTFQTGLTSLLRYSVLYHSIRDCKCYKLNVCQIFYSYQTSSDLLVSIIGFFESALVELHLKRIVIMLVE